jgi:DNA-directed RNA polymerase subunit beta
MNIGQILETILGFVGRVLGERLQAMMQNSGYASIKEELQKFYGQDLIDSYESSYGRDQVIELARKTAQQGVFYETPVFDGANYQEDLRPLLKDLDLPDACSFMVRDGRTGQYFDQPVTVGSMYVIKLDHMVDDKLHARAVGPYSLVTQQPLGGKAQRGGQRLGEMEVWALEAYGAAYTLQEMLTYKSDDVSGRHQVYEDIVRGDEISEPGVPESFNVLIKELQSLGLRVDLFKSDKEKIDE